MYSGGMPPVAGAAADGEEDGLVFRCKSVHAFIFCHMFPNPIQSYLFIIILIVDVKNIAKVNSELFYRTSHLNYY